MDDPRDRTEDAILPSRHLNADRLSTMLRGQHIASPMRVTNQAIIDAVMAGRPRRGLDVGWREGWLARLGEVGRGARQRAAQGQ